MVSEINNSESCRSSEKSAAQTAALFQAAIARRWNRGSQTAEACWVLRYNFLAKAGMTVKCILAV